MNIPESFDYEQANCIPLLQTLGIRLTRSDATSATMEVTVDQRHLNFYGGAHGGLLATLVDTVSFFPLVCIPSGRSLTTTNLQVTYLRPAKAGDHLRAVATVIHSGRRTISVTVAVLDQNDRHLVQGSVSLLVVSDTASPTT